ncbi:MAG: 50S ribosomal protein L11 methyltransferase [Clostridia bacterium]|nr:50S ribosomal protein L11 methyltransferase [Clostridia bacterium]
MKWKELTITTSEEGIEIVLARLDMLGIQQVNIVQGHDEVDALLHSAEKYWDYAEEAVLDAQPAVQAYFSELPENGDTERMIRESIEELSTMREELGLDLGSLEIGVRTVDEEDWANNWKAYFKPINVGERLLVCPSWEEVPEDNTRAVLKIDPGMAFGTGTHHTTRMCLEMLEKSIKEGDLVADLGCGSGILSIAAALLGAREVHGIDIDPVASRVAVENAELNGVDKDSFFVMNGDILTDPDFRRSVSNGEYDIVLANIVANVIIAFAYLLPSMMKKGGLLIASGIIEDRLDEVVAELEDCGLEILEIANGDDWRAVLARKLDD